eukprot:TRINITY_DN411_c0_g1_i1.p1 TRINITY_DN411_c0_g1~~TRINITY_DN411_c0_g1_i1.p1  ORF type:complete len:282 (+),score=114.45 TRINITY_DN411_c0_g1_i1:48-893(+)
MGGDGGVCANDRRYMPQSGFGEVKQREKDKQTVDRERWARCQYSKLPLTPPLLADKAGQLYSMEHVIVALKKKESIAPYITGLKDFARLSPEENKEKAAMLAKLRSGEEAGESVEDLLDLYECPVTQQTTNGLNKFCCATSCGHVFSQRSVQQMGSGQCPVCGAPTTTIADWAKATPEEAAGNVIVDLVLDMDVLDVVTAQLQARKEAEKKEKEARKAAAAGIGEGEEAGAPPKKRAKKEKKDKAAKPSKGAVAVPAGADPEVFKSLFKPKSNDKATFLCR